jgi:hypothetical protein
MNNKFLKMAFAGLVLGVSGFANAGVIYSTGFESGALGSEWTTASSDTAGRIQVLTTTGLWAGVSSGPHSGSYFLGMDSIGGYVNNEAILSIDLTGLQNVVLDFWWAEWNDESSSPDGVFFSVDGGANYFSVQALLGDDYIDLTWQNFSINLSEKASLNGLSLGSDVRIKFQQYDNYYFAGGNDGFLFDDISISANANVVPEPSTLAIFALGLVGLASRRFKKH